MPIYEYRCESCGHEFDVLQKISDAPLRDCPACEGPALRRLVSAPSFRLKGDGWYETDFKSDKEKKRNLVDAPADGKGDKAEKKGKDADESTKTPGEKTKKVNLSSDSKKDSGSGSKKDSGTAAA